jgi:hypothetical protein
MIRTQILLHPQQHQLLSEIARLEERSLSDLVRESVDRWLAARRRAALTLAAQALLPDYTPPSELTAFHPLDGEAFHA